MADGAPQIWDIPLTPSQRWALTQVAFDKAAPQITDAAAGKALRRALRAFGLMEVRDALRAHDGKVSPEYTIDTTPARHKITRDNLDCVLGWRNIPRHPSTELDAGDVFDLLEEIKADPSWSYIGPDVPPFTSDAEKWKPPAVDPFSITCPSCSQQFDLAELGAERRR
jgi:hypothetical protein